MNTKYVLDAWAWIEYLDGSSTGKEVSDKIKEGNAYTNVVTLAEVIKTQAIPQTPILQIGVRNRHDRRQKYPKGI